MLEKIHLESTENNKKEEYLEAGADYVIGSLAELKEMIQKIYLRLACGERP